MCGTYSDKLFGQTIYVNGASLIREVKVAICGIDATMNHTSQLIIYFRRFWGSVEFGNSNYFSSRLCLLSIRIYTIFLIANNCIRRRFDTRYAKVCLKRTIHQDFFAVHIWVLNEVQSSTKGAVRQLQWHTVSCIGFICRYSKQKVGVIASLCACVLVSARREWSVELSAT